MVLALQILLWLIGLILLLLILALVLPLRLRLSFRSDPQSRYHVTVCPFGMRLTGIRVHDSRRRAPEEAQKTPKRKARKKRSRLKARTDAILTLPATLGQMIRAVHIDDLRIDGEFGLGDPADTGQLYGQLTPLIYGSRAQVNLRPNFDMACLRGAADMQLRVIPIVFLWPIAGFLWRMFGPFE